MDLIKDLSELGNIVAEIYSIYSDCVVDSTVEELVSDSEIEAASSAITSLSAIRAHVNDESDNNYERAVTRIAMCMERAKPILIRMGKVDLNGDNGLIIGELTKKSVSDFSNEIHDLNDFVRMANRLIKNKPINPSKKNEVKLLQAFKDAFNRLMSSVNEVVVEHNSYFKDDKSMQVDRVDLVE